MEPFPISRATWSRLTEANKVAVQAGWAQDGVFATGVGPDYLPEQPWSLLYVGKSAGPLGQAVGSSHDQAASAEASRKWMVSRQNPDSAFWQFIEQIDPTRRRIAWTNISKMDQQGGKRPPSDAQFRQIAAECMDALEEEMNALRPRVTLFATSGFCDDYLAGLLERLGYHSHTPAFHDRWNTCVLSSGPRLVIRTKHPQGFPIRDRQRVIDLLRDVLQ